MSDDHEQPGMNAIPVGTVSSAPPYRLVKIHGIRINGVEIGQLDTGPGIRAEQIQAIVRRIGDASGAVPGTAFADLLNAIQACKAENRRLN